MSEEDVRIIVDGKKTSMFKTFLNRPKKDEIHTHSLKLCYECIMIVSGKYSANYYRKAIHALSVDGNVKEIVFGDGVFPTRTKSGLKKVVTGNYGKNKIDLPVEEHVFIEETGEVVIDHHGNELKKMPYKINSKTIENYPKRILEHNSANVKKLEITNDKAIKMLTEKLKKPLESNVRDLVDELVLDDISEIYVPIYEARLVGPKNKIEIMRIDAVRNKVL